MLDTPWGDAHNLSARALRPGPGASRDDALRNRRERLMAAMVGSVAERGYAATTVTHLTTLACVSRSAFYGQFRSKEDCLVATIDEIAALADGTTERAFAEPGSWEERLLALLQTVIDLVVAYPATARICYVDAYTAGAEPIAHADAVLELFIAKGRRALAESPERTALPPEIVRAVVGGIQEVIAAHVVEGREADLPAETHALWSWAMSYRTPAEPLKRARRRSRPPGSPRRIDADPEERILRAMADTVAERGYVATTVADVTRTAGTSLRTFYAHFDGKEDAFLAALDHARAQILAAVQPSVWRASDWQSAVRDGFRALFSFLAVETGWAAVGAEARSAGTAAAKHAQETIRMFGELLTPEVAATNEKSDVVPAAVSAAIYALIAQQIRAGNVARLPELAPFATFIAIAPYVGVEAALAIASDPPEGRRAV